ncbi:hypothetical protein ABW20_dc0107163 [Dactylellina cionopaga]|nr:hypothetical protein ABW20_dc0107163 [Dactylellina cionopaga]
MGDKIYAVHALHARYGPYVRISPNEIAVADLPSVLRIHSSIDVYDKTEWYRKMTAGLDIMASLEDHEEFAFRRKAFGLGFSNTNVSKLEPVVRRHVNGCVAKIKGILERDGIVDVMPWLQLVGTDIIAELCYGKDFGLVEEGKMNDFVRSLVGSLFIIGARAQIPAFPFVEQLLHYIPHAKIQWFIGCNDRITKYGNNCLGELRREIADCKDGKVRPSLFTQILDNTNNPDAKYRMGIRTIRDEAGAMLIAGSQSVALSATYFFWAINRHPLPCKKLVQELEGIGWDITDERLRNLPYLNATTKEVMRLYSPGQMGTPRVVPKGGRQLGPYFFPGGTHVTPQGYSTHRDPTVFKEPFSFEPERWLNPTKEMESAMIAFGGASRLCIGRDLALMELRLIVAIMLKECPNTALAESCTDESMEFQDTTALGCKYYDDLDETPV